MVPFEILLNWKILIPPRGDFSLTLLKSVKYNPINAKFFGMLTFWNFIELNRRITGFYYSLATFFDLSFAD